MKEIFIYLTIVVVAIIICVIAYYISKKAVEESEKNFYVYPKTEHKYKILYRCKMKLPIERTWIDALIYMGIDDGKLYVRERKDFFDKFVKLSDWKNGNKGK